MLRGLKAGARRAGARLGLKPRSFTLVSGCPRTGTSALLWWLSEQDGVVARLESRILLTAHAALKEAGRFGPLRAGRASVVESTARSVLRFYAEDAWLWGRALVDKEPTEPVAFPDGDYAGFLDHVRELFPEVRTILMTRHPVPTIWSMRQRSWGHSLAAGDPVEWSLPECLDVWKANARIAAARGGDAGTLVCRFEEMTTDPAGVSRAVADFVGLGPTTPFVPKATKEVGFDLPEIDVILEETRDERELLGYGENGPVEGRASGA